MKDCDKKLKWFVNEDSIQMLIQYRSLYILKRKFEIFKADIATLYSSFESPSLNADLKDHKVIDISGFEPLLNSVALLLNILIIPIDKPNELYITDLYSQADNEAKSNETKHNISLFAKECIEHYNTTYYNKRISKPAIPEEIAKAAEVEGEESNEWDSAHPMVQYDKKGRMVYTYNQLKDMNSLGYVANKERKARQEEEEEGGGKGEVLEKGKLFAETLPLIVADYIQRNPNVVIIDLDKDDVELQTELRGIFDREILSKLGEDLNRLKSEIEEMNNEVNSKMQKLKEQYQTIKKNIELYQRLLIQAESSDDPNAVYFKEILAKLQHEKSLIEAELIQCASRVADKTHQNQMRNIDAKRLKSEHSLKSKDNNDISSTLLKQSKSNDSLFLKEERKEVALNEIFHFYTNQHTFAGLYPLFERIQKKVNNLDLSEFGKFCVDFKVEVSKETLVELFKKHSSDRKHMSYAFFKEAIRKISVAMSNTRRANLSKKIEKAKEQLMFMNNSPEVNSFRWKSVFSSPKNNKSSADKDDYNTHRVPPKEATYLFTSKKSQLNSTLMSLEAELGVLSNYTNEQILEQFYSYLGIDADYSYRKKMKGFIISFHSKQERHLFWDTAPNKLPSIKNYNMRVSELTKLQMSREKQLKENRLKKLKEDLYKAELSELNNNKLKLKVKSIIKMEHNTYQEISNKQRLNQQIESEIIEEISKNKLTWEQIEKMKEIDDLKLENNKNDTNALEELLMYDSDDSDDLEILKHLKTKAEQNENENERSKAIEDISDIKAIKASNEDKSANVNIDTQANYKLFQKNPNKVQTLTEPNTEHNAIELQSKNIIEYNSNSKLIASQNSSFNPPSMALNNRYINKSRENIRQRPLITSAENNIFSSYKASEGKGKGNRYQNDSNPLFKHYQEKPANERLITLKNHRDKQLNSQMQEQFKK